MALFQIRYAGDEAPEPETLSAADLDEAERTARRRLEASRAVGATLSRDGRVVRRLFPSRVGLPPALERRLIEAGVYVFAGPDRV